MIVSLIAEAPALAYLGPGGALTLFGSALALLAAIAVAFFGLIWYPLKRLIRWWRGRSRPSVVAADSPTPPGGARG